MSHLQRRIPQTQTPFRSSASTVYAQPNLSLWEKHSWISKTFFIYSLRISFVYTMYFYYVASLLQLLQDPSHRGSGSTARSLSTVPAALVSMSCGPPPEKGQLTRGNIRKKTGSSFPSSQQLLIASLLEAGIHEPPPHPWWNLY